MPRTRLVVPAAVLALLTTAGAPAAAQTWTGAALNGSWTTAGNWNPSGVPNSAAADVTFGSAGVGTVNIASPIQVNSVTFADVGTGNFTLLGGTLTTTAITVTGNSTGVQTVNLSAIGTGSLLFPSGVGLTLTNNADGSLVLGPNTVIGTPGGGGVIVNGTGGPTTISGSFAGGSNNVISGVTKNALGDLTLSGNNANLTGPTTVNSGQLVADYSATAGRKLPTGALTLTGSVLSLLASGTSSANETVAGVTVGSGASTVSLASSVGSPQPLSLSLGPSINRTGGGTLDIDRNF
ncbi:MAG TPA: hypothetical protein VGF55_21295, partial [Gemmataceae bacterium]